MCRSFFDLPKLLYLQNLGNFCQSGFGRSFCRIERPKLWPKHASVDHCMPTPVTINCGANIDCVHCGSLYGCFSTDEADTRESSRGQMGSGMKREEGVGLVGLDIVAPWIWIKTCDMKLLTQFLCQVLLCLHGLWYWDLCDFLTLFRQNKIKCPIEISKTIDIEFIFC